MNKQENNMISTGISYAPGLLIIMYQHGVHKKSTLWTVVTVLNGQTYTEEDVQ